MGDLHPHCFSHRGCPRTRAGGDLGNKACQYCKEWSELQLQAFAKRRAAWEREHSLTQGELPLAGASRPSSPPPHLDSSVSVSAVLGEGSHSPIPVDDPAASPPGTPSDQTLSAPAAASAEAPLTLALLRELLAHQEQSFSARLACLSDRLSQRSVPVCGSPLPSTSKEMEPVADSNSVSSYRSRCISSDERPPSPLTARSHHSRHSPGGAGVRAVPSSPQSLDGRSRGGATAACRRVDLPVVVRVELVRVLPSQASWGRPRYHARDDGTSRSRDRSVPTRGRKRTRSSPQGRYGDRDYSPRSFEHSPHGSRDRESRSRSSDSDRSASPLHSGIRRRRRSTSTDRIPDSVPEGGFSTFREALQRLVDLGKATPLAAKNEPVSHPERKSRVLNVRGVAPHVSVDRWIDVVLTSLDRHPEAKVNTPFTLSVLRSTCARYEAANEDTFLHQARDRPRGFREVSTLADDEAVARLAKAPLSLHHRQHEALDRLIRATVTSVSYSRHFMGGASAELDQVRRDLANLRSSVFSLDRETIADKLAQLECTADSAADFLAHADLSASDTVGTAVGLDVNLTLAQRDKFIPKLRSYLGLRHRRSLRNGTFRSKDLLPTLPEVTTAAREDAQHESTRQLASIKWSASHRPSSAVPPRAGGNKHPPMRVAGLDRRPRPPQVRPPEPVVQRGTSTAALSRTGGDRRDLGASRPNGTDSPPAPALQASGPLSCADERPVGGCLSRYLAAWREITDDPWVLSVIADGYAPTFAGSRPSLTRVWSAHESATPGNRDALIQEARSLALKQATEKVSRPESLGFYSRIFLVPKKNGQLRPVINLRPLNRVLHCPHFQMETVGSISAAVQPGDWATSVDLTDAYFHIPIAPWFRKYLRFVVAGEVFQFRALPFGLAPAPLVCTRLLAPLAVHLHTQGVLFHRYLDDLLIRATSPDLCHRWTSLTLSTLRHLGLGVNLDKSELSPSQDFVYVGVRFRTDVGLSCPPEPRIQSALGACRQLTQSGKAPAHAWLSLLGILSALEKLVPFGRLHIRPIHFCLRRQFKIGVHTLGREVQLDPPAHSALQWWMDLSHLAVGVPLGPYIPQVTLYTDASNLCWGAHAVGFQANGEWADHERPLSINALELLAVLRALQADPSFWRGKRILVASDNTSAVSYINRQGGTHSMSLMDITQDLFAFILDMEMTIRARHIPGRLNRTADLLSRTDQVVTTEWTLNRQVAAQLWTVWGTPNIDLMATELTHQLPVYISPYPDPRAFAVDAMSCDWKGMDAYLFPPWPMLAEVLRKLTTESLCLVTLIAPRWPNRPWFPLLLSLLIDHPITLPPLEDLIGMPHNDRRFGAIHSLDLHACRLSSDRRLTRDFLQRCRAASLRASCVPPPRASTTRSGRSSLFGVSDGVPIHSRPL